jgi:hypothetical protein
MRGPASPKENCISDTHQEMSGELHAQKHLHQCIHLLSN